MFRRGKNQSFISLTLSSSILGCLDNVHPKSLDKVSDQIFLGHDLSDIAYEPPTPSRPLSTDAILRLTELHPPPPRLSAQLEMGDQSLFGGRIQVHIPYYVQGGPDDPVRGMGYLASSERQMR
ncbi:hypothetical protein Bpfe_012813 [Biomphalaria pfeifferi]|uniref:Uncharacterized protein n=1 Tax=Biomphalaria pfeifferi TaxID=112525 RepID=A0AAD8FAK5_BIOPF|nr:hypothetical protein Bpfe_012813 [Biomphalaria pfeifferi]